ncbi:MAG TPA: hypothetical protein VIV61_11675 [Candidatus Ozemobacteraceae bacterium]
MHLKCGNCGFSHRFPGVFPFFVSLFIGCALAGISLALLPLPAIIIIPAAPVVALLFTLTARLVPLLLFYLLHVTRACPSCGQRKWHFPEYSAFGL